MYGRRQLLCCTFMRQQMYDRRQLSCCTFMRQQMYDRRQLSCCTFMRQEMYDRRQLSCCTFMWQEMYDRRQLSCCTLKSHFAFDMSILSQIRWHYICWMHHLHLVVSNEVWKKKLVELHENEETILKIVFRDANCWFYMFVNSALQLCWHIPT